VTPPKGQRLGGRGKPPEPTSTRTDPPAPTAPETPEETPVETPAGNGQTVRPTRPARTRTVVEAPAELDKDALGDWRWRLGATAGKAVKAQQRANEAARAWERVVAEARNAGVPERLLMAAALEADMDLPAAE
jgi:hypothetical protein